MLMLAACSLGLALATGDPSLGRAMAGREATAAVASIETNLYDTGGPTPTPGPGGGGSGPGPNLGGPCGDPWIAPPQDVLPHSEQGRRAADGLAEHGPG